MKKLLLLLIIPALIYGCQSNSYYNAMNTNEQRFDGWQKENAIFLTETHDMTLLIEDLSELAQKKSKLRETFLLAEDIDQRMEELKNLYKIESTIHRIKLASSLSDNRDKILHKLEEVNEDNFDDVFKRYLKSELDELDKRAHTYKSEGHNERIREFADKITETIEDIHEAHLQKS